MNPREDELLQPVLREPVTLRHRFTHMLKSLINDPSQGCRRILMRFKLAISPHSLEGLNQVGRAHDIDPETSDQLDRAGIDAGDIGHGIQRRILHRNTTASV